MKISASTRPYALLGHPVGHSLSPVMHNAAFQSLAMDAVYLALDVTAGRLIDALNVMRDLGFGGANVTVPLKEVAFGKLSQLDSSASRLGAVNTVEFSRGGEIKGYNTDGFGLLAGIQEAFGVGIKGLSVLVIGCGGAGRAVAITCATEGAKTLGISDLESARAIKLADDISRLVPSIAIEAVGADRDSLSEASLAADLVIQATPVGMKKEEPSLLGSDAFRRGQMVYDLVYMYPETAFMKAAAQSGARAANGLGMLLHQGARSFSIWTGTKAPLEAMRQALMVEVYSR